jgi:hypothetical protein
MEHDSGIAIFAQGATCCAVCAPRMTAEEVVESAVAVLNRGGCDWNTLEVRYFEDLNPRTCPRDGMRQHWLLVRPEE